MANTVIQVSDVFPVGTSVTAHSRTGAGQRSRAGDSNAGLAVVETQTVDAAGNLTFTTLVTGTIYYLYAQVEGTFTTQLAGANNDLVFTGKGGDADATYSVRYVDPGAVSKALAVTVGPLGEAITVTLATDGAGAITSTATQVKAAIDGYPAAAALVSVANAAGNDGTGVVAAMAKSLLSAGGRRWKQIVGA